MKIEKAQIIREALALLDERGLDQLSMRTLAERLDVKASAIYWHVAHKAELINLMTQDFFQRANRAAPRGVGWREWLLGFGRALHRILVSHRDAARLCAIADPGLERLQVELDRLVSPLQAAGFDWATAVSYETAVISLTLGCAIFEESKLLRDFFKEDISFKKSFDRGLRAMVGGFAEPGSA
jgi:TetR/AcrR family transcriptional regulator, tetracycline repressor protein